MQCSKNNNRNSNNNDSSKLTCTKKLKSGVKKKSQPEVHPMVIVTVPPFPSN